MQNLLIFTSLGVSDSWPKKTSETKSLSESSYTKPTLNCRLLIGWYAKRVYSQTNE